MKRTRVTTPKTKSASGAAVVATMTGLQALGVKKLTELVQGRRQPEKRSRLQRLAGGRTKGLLLAAAGVGGAYYLGRGGRMSSAMQRVKGRLASSRNLETTGQDAGVVAPVQPPPPDPFVATPPATASPPSTDGPSS